MSVKVAVAGVGVMVAVSVGVTYRVAVADAAGGAVGAAGNNAVYEHPDNIKLKREIRLTHLMRHLNTKPSGSTYGTKLLYY